MSTFTIVTLFALAFVGSVLSGIAFVLLCYREQFWFLTAITLFRKRKQQVVLSYTEDVRRTLNVLKQLQVLIGRDAAEQDPGLLDIMRLLQDMQHVFGRSASLEAVIQALVAQDIKHQLVTRKLKYPTRSIEDHC